MRSASPGCRVLIRHGASCIAEPINRLPWPKKCLASGARASPSPELAIEPFLMAQSLRRPLCQVVGLTFSPVPRRCFSQIHPLRAPAPGGAPGRAHVSYGGARSKERSMKAMSKEVMTVPNDMGILEGMYILPPKPLPAINRLTLITPPQKHSSPQLAPTPPPYSASPSTT